jgi:hypothetical protein
MGDWEAWREKTMQDTFFGFEVQRPSRLSRFASPEPRLKEKDVPAPYFDEMGITANMLIADKPDGRSRCALPVPGTMMGQLEKIARNPDLLLCREFHVGTR